MAAAQTQIANSHLEQTDAQIQVLKTELENVSPFNSNLQVLNDHSKNVSREIQTLKQGMEGAAALNSKTQTLEDNLQKANAEIQRLKEDFEDTKKILTMKIQEEYSRLENLSASFASQEQLQKTKSKWEGGGWPAEGTVHRESRISCSFVLLLTSSRIPLGKSVGAGEGPNPAK